MAPVKRPLLERFEAKYTPEPNSGCWLWTAATNNYGYGTIKSAGHGTLAHRVSWELHNGPIPEGISVCHKCDTPSCVNPDHLFVGSQHDNMRDAKNKGRLPSRRGEGNGRSKFTENDVRAIRRIYARGEANTVQLAERFGIAKSSISHIITGKRWSDSDE